MNTKDIIAISATVSVFISVTLISRRYIIPYIVNGTGNTIGYMDIVFFLSLLAIAVVNTACLMTIGALP